VSDAPRLEAPPCPHCGGRKGVSFGTASRSLLSLKEGRLRRESGPVQRWRCACNHVFADDRRVSEHAVLEHVSQMAIRLGSSATAAKLGCDEKTVETSLARWLALHCDDRTDVPEVMMLVGVTTAGRRRLVVGDADDATLLDFLEDRGALVGWAAGREGAPALVLVEYDGRALAEVRDVFPDATAVLAVSETASAIQQVAAKGFATSRSSAIQRGTNARLDADLFERRRGDISATDREEISSWPDDARTLFVAKNALLDALELKPGPERDRLWALSESDLSTISSGAGLLRFLSTWREAIVAGLANRWSDDPWRDLVALKEAISKARPRAGGAILRAILLVETPTMVGSAEAYPGSFLSTHAPARRSLEEAASTMLGFSASHESPDRELTCSAR